MRVILLAGLLFILCRLGESGVVKILEGVDRKSDKDENVVDFIEPDPMYGPRDLFFLKGSCFTGSFDRYEYQICPFHNVTQRRTTAMKPQVIGVWGNWKTTLSTVHQQKGQLKAKPAPGTSGEAPTAIQTETVTAPAGEAHSYYNVMEFMHGRNCGQGQGFTTIYLECEHSKFEVKSVDSEINCEYALTLGLPIACSLLRK